MGSGKSIFCHIILMFSLLFCLSQKASAFTLNNFSKGSFWEESTISKGKGYQLQNNFSKEKPHKKYKEGELLVKFKPSVSAYRQQNIHAKQNSQVVKKFDSIRIHHVKLPPELSIEEAIKSYNSDPDVEYAEPNYILTGQNIPNDPQFNNLWGLHNIGQTLNETFNGTPGSDIKAPEAWNITTGNNNVIVAILDTGIDYTHQDLTSNIWINPGEIDGNNIDDDRNGYTDDIHGINTYSQNSDPMDDNGHGTHVAGIIGAIGNNNIGVVGVNWHVKIMACKFLDSSGSGYIDGAIECLQYVKATKDAGINIVATNNSWGCSNDCYSQALYDAINAQRDILFIAAAGNDSMDNDLYPTYPASFNLPNIISVAATNWHDDLASWFSNYGKHSVHIGAPGEYILSTFLDNDYNYFDGTSMSAPYVTGVAALLKAQNESRDWKDIRNLILSGGDDITSLDTLTITGKRLNAYGSLTCNNKPVFSVLNIPSSFSIGVPITLSALSISCASPAGVVTVTTAAGDLITLHDDGIAPDLASGDGIFTGTWIPSRSGERLYFSFVSTYGTKNETVFIPKLYTHNEILNLNLNEVYSYFLKANGGLSPYTWSIISGNLPPGLTLNPSTGELSGTASSPGIFTFTVQIADSLSQTTSWTYSIRVTEDFLNEQWRAIFETNDHPGFMGIGIDKDGNSYVVGDSYIDPYPYNHFVIIKYAPSGNILFNKPIIIGDSEMFEDMTVDRDGNIYMIGNIKINKTSYWTGYQAVIKFDSSGNIVWANNIDYPLTGVAVDKNGNVYVSGNNGSYSFLIKYGSSGNIIWRKQYDDYNNTGNITIDRDENIIVSGTSYDDNFNFWNFVTKNDSDGNVIWTNKSDLGYFFQLWHGVTTDKDNNVYVIRQSVNNPDWHALIMKFGPSGSLIWSVPYYGYEANTITVDENNYVYVTGAGYILDEITQGYHQFYLTIKYDQSGKVIWTKRSEDGPGNLPIGIALDGKGSVFVTGFSGTNNDWLTIKYNDLEILTSELSSGILNQPYAFSLDASYGKTPYTWSITSGGLPQGLSLNSKTGVISGTPARKGYSVFTVSATDIRSNTAFKSLSLDIAPVTTTTSINTSVNPSMNKQSVVFTATTTSPSDIPSGTITFMDDAEVLGTNTLSGNPATATFVTSTLSSGTHSITAIYGGNDVFASSSSDVLSQTIKGAISIVINDGAEVTDNKLVKLTFMLPENSSEITMLCLSNSTECKSWTTYASPQYWKLNKNNGLKTVYIWFKDISGNTNSIPYSAQIILDTKAPRKGTLSATSGDSQVILNWKGFTDSSSGIANYRLVYSTSSSPKSCSQGILINNFDSSITTYPHTGLTNGETYYYRLCAIDKAGNISKSAVANARPSLE